MDGLYTVVEFSKDDKWFVISEKIIDGIKYSYLIRVNEKEDDFINEFQIAKSYYDGSAEYMDIVSDKEMIKKIMPVLMPEAEEYINNPKKLKELLNQAS